MNSFFGGVNIEYNFDKTKLQNLVDLAGILNEQRDFQEILRGVSQHAISHLSAENCLILMINPRTRQTVKTLQRDSSRKMHQDFQVLQDLVSGWIMVNNQSFLSDDITKDPRYNHAHFDGLNVKSVLGVPLSVEGILIGTILLVNKNGSRHFDQTDLAYMTKLSVIAAPYLRNSQKIQQYFESPLPESSLIAKYAELGLLGKSQKFIDNLKAIQAAACCDVRVLLEGPSGTGKELLARAIHSVSQRRGRFVAIDCGAIPENLLESELFGHVKGAFTHANSSRKGLIEEANGGTLFMDEIANLPLPMQAKLMRFLQESEVRAVGSNRARVVDVRVITASSVSLRKLVERNRFREDLFFRLHVYPIVIAPLRERQDDIPVLANHFLKYFNQKQKKRLKAFHGEIMEFICQAPWQGNVRELENWVERMVTVAPKTALTITSDMLPADLQEELALYRSKAGIENASEPLKQQLNRHESSIIKDVLIDCNWNQSEAARRLGISEKNIRFKMRKLNIKRSFENPPSNSS